MNKPYTKTGDDGKTGWLGEGRLPKFHPRMEAVGALDEAAAALGLARSLCAAPEIPSIITQVQRDLYGLMAEVAAAPENAARFRQIDAQRIAWLEAQIDALSARLEMPKEFILPGQSAGSGALSLARAIVRRAERYIARLFQENMLENAAIQQYINRLSSLCFTLELHENAFQGIQTQTQKS